MKNNVIALLILFQLISCGNIKKLDTEKVKEQMKKSTIKKVMEKDILVEIENQTSKISIKDCQSEGMEMTDLKDNTFKGKTFEVMQAYQYSISKNETIGSNLQKINDTTYLYTIPVPEEISKKCGKVLAYRYFNKTEIIKAIQ